jgi:hypothetical protein
MVLLMLCLHRSRPGFGTGSMHQPPSPEDFKSKSSLATIHCVLLLLGVRKCMNLSWYGQDQILTYTSAPSQLPASHAIHTWPVILINLSLYQEMSSTTKESKPSVNLSLTRTSQSVFFNDFGVGRNCFCKNLNLAKSHLFMVNASSCEQQVASNDKPCSPWRLENQA